MPQDWSAHANRTLSTLQTNAFVVRRLTIGERLLRDPRSTAELFEIALDEERDGYGPGSAHEALIVLHERATPEVLERAIALCRHASAAHRILGARVLGELGPPPRAFPDACGEELLRLVATDEDIEVMIAAIFALGHLRHTSAEDPRIIGLRSHPDDRVRHAVAFALCGCTSDESVRALLELMSDPEPLARDWATTAIGGTVELDGPEVRAALLQRATDVDEITRAEALHGLARRHDERVVPYLLAELAHPREKLHLVEAAASCYLGLPEDQKVERDFLLVALRY